MIQPPLIDSRMPADVADQTRALLCRFLEPAPYNWPADADGGEAGRALTQIFAHYCGLIIDGLNGAPEKNFLAFLDLLGNSLIAAQPARAAVTFTLDASAGRGLLLPLGTRVQADPPPGSTDPLFFETENDLWLTPLRLMSFAAGALDLTAIIGSSAGNANPVFKDLQAMVFCFALNPGLPLPAELPVEIYFWLDSAGYDPVTWGTGASEPAALDWEYSANGTSGWTRLLVEDETQALTRSGVVRFLAPAAAAWGTLTNSQETLSAFWVRAKPPAAAYTPSPLLRCVATNTVTAIEAMTVANEILGSSNGSTGQTFRILKLPVLAGQQLGVLEQPVATASSPAYPWTGWTEVADFHGSLPLDRHYVLNRETGEVRFGDGKQGMIPPRGARNIRMTTYRAGGGASGNVAAGAITSLTTGSKQIAGLANLFPATGGADAEEMPSLLDRAPRSLRHRGRAVTQEDYEDLSRLSTTEVARALCVPLQNLAVDPYGVIGSAADEKKGAGEVSVIVVPHSSATKPLPSPDLMRRVQTYLVERASADAHVTVAGPLYLRVDIAADIHLQTLQAKDTVERGLRDEFTAFLHPLTGNSGAGWPFGRLPHESDLYALIAGLKRIAYVAALSIVAVADDLSRTDDTVKTGRFLIYSGTHTIRFV